MERALTLKGVHLPVLLEELPDVVACVVAGRRHVGFCRIPAAALLKEQMRGAPTGTGSRPRRRGAASATRTRAPCCCSSAWG